MKTIFCSYPQDLMRTEHRRTTFIQPFLICLLATSEAWALTLTWSGGSGNWSDPLQWSPNGVPQNGDDLVFNNSLTWNRMRHHLTEAGTDSVLPTSRTHPRLRVRLARKVPALPATTDSLSGSMNHFSRVK